MAFLVDTDLFGGFIAVIQLITAVDFANINFRFHEKVFAVLFNADRIYRVKFGELTLRMAADLDSIELMQPIVTQNKKTNKATIEELRQAYDALMKEWNKKGEQVKNRIQSCVQVKGVKSLFLFVSLYCLYDLFLMPFVHVCNWNAVYCLCLLNALSIVVLAIYTISIVRKKKSGKEDVQLYKRISCYSVITMVVAFSTVFWGGYIEFDGLQSLQRVLLWLSVALPFYPCLFCIVYILWNEVNINLYVNRETKPLRQKQMELHKRKVELDKMYVILTDVSELEDDRVSVSFD